MTLHAAYIRDQDGGYRTQHCSALTFKHTVLKSLQVRAITHLALMRFFQLNYVLNKSQRQDLNLQPADYETAALPIELRGHGMDAGFHPVVFTCERITGIEPAFPAWEAGIFVSCFYTSSVSFRPHIFVKFRRRDLHPQLLRVSHVSALCFALIRISGLRRQYLLLRVNVHFPDILYYLFYTTPEAVGRT